MGGRFALIIGIDRYQESGNDLAGCEADARSFEAFFRSDRGGSFNENEVLTLLNEQATRDIIVRVLSLLADQGPWGQIHVVFAGHGSDDGIVAHDGMIAYHEIQAALERIDFRNALLILDSCQSGALIDTLSVSGAPIQRNPQRVREYLKRLSEAVEGVRVITATDRRHYAEEVDGRGAFSYTLLRAARRSKPDLGSAISARRVLDVAADELWDAGFPIPEGLGELGDYPFAVAALPNPKPAPRTVVQQSQSSSSPLPWLLGAGLLLLGGLAAKRSSQWDGSVGRYRGSDGRFKR